MAEQVGDRRAGQSRCPACGRLDGEQVLRLPPVPVHVGLLWRTADEARSCAMGDFDLALCHGCGYVWNTAFDAGRLHYEDDYDNALHFSPKFAAWEQDLAARLVERHRLRSRRLAEIGCGDGRFLALLCLAGDNEGVGFEPGHNHDRVSDLVDGGAVQIVDAFADADTLRGGDFDFVLARHLLEHLPEPTVLIDAVRNGTDSGSGVYIEVPNFEWALDRGAFEDLMYEHCGYYTPATLGHLLCRSGFDDVVADSTFDGLFAAVEASVGTRAPVDEAIDPGVVDPLRAKVAQLGSRIAEVDAAIAERRDRGQRLVAWGGGARAVGLLNLVGSSTAIERVVDVNPRKQGTYVTGTGHPIVAPADLVGSEPDGVIVVNPVYRAEIAAMLSDLGVGAEVITV